METVVKFLVSNTIVKLIFELLLIILIDRLVGFSISKINKKKNISFMVRSIISLVTIVVLIIGMLYIDSEITSYSEELNNEKLTNNIKNIVEENHENTLAEITDTLSNFGIDESIANEISNLYLEAEKSKLRIVELEESSLESVAMKEELEKAQTTIELIEEENTELLVIVEEKDKELLQIEDEVESLISTQGIAVNKTAESVVYKVSINGSDSIYQDYWNKATPFMIDGREYTGNITGVAIAGETRMSGSYQYQMPTFYFDNSDLENSTFTFSAAIDDMTASIDYYAGSGVYVIGKSPELGMKVLGFKELQRSGKIDDFSVNIKGYQNVYISIVPARSNYDTYSLDMETFKYYDGSHPLAESLKDYVLLFDMMMR